MEEASSITELKLPRFYVSKDHKQIVILNCDLLCVCTIWARWRYDDLGSSRAVRSAQTGELS